MTRVSRHHYGLVSLFDVRLSYTDDNCRDYRVTLLAISNLSRRDKEQTIQKRKNLSGDLEPIRM